MNDATTGVPSPRGDIARRQLILGRVGALVAIVGAVFLIVAVAVNWDTVVTTLRDGNLVLLFLSAVPLLLIQVSTLAVGKGVLAAHGEKSLAARDLYRILFAANLAKYVPGGVWQVGSQYQLTRSAGVGARGSILLWVEMARATVAAMLVVSGLAFLWSGSGQLPAWVGMIGVVSGVVAALPVTGRWGLRMVKLRSADEPLHPVPWLLTLAAATVTAVLVAVHGYLLMEALHPDSGIDFVAAVAAFPGAWVTGFLVFFVPGGLGVREGALIVLLSPWLDGPAALGVAAASRVVFIGVDALGGFVAGSLAAGRNRAGNT